jgi:hypothetical protein
LYNEGYKANTEGSSLYFGTAVDTAVGAMLTGNPDWLQVFYDKWEFQALNGNPIRIFDNARVTYSHKDFDADVLEDKDFAKLSAWAKELGFFGITDSPTNAQLVDLYKVASKAKASPYIKLTDEQYKYFNRCSWLSMKRKGKLLLTAFKDQFVPKIKKVHALQKRSKIEDPNSGDSIVGYIDMILEIDGYDKPIIFDLKTAGMYYDQATIDLSPQLTLYSAMEARNYNTDLVGYVVLCKNINKDELSTCSVCGSKKTSSHRTCNANKTDGTRCNGAWLESRVCNPRIQVMVEQKSQTQINDLLEDISNLILAMKNRIVYKNTKKCTDWYGAVCPYYNLCHKGDASGLTKTK